MESAITHIHWSQHMQKRTHVTPAHAVPDIRPYPNVVRKLLLANANSHAIRPVEKPPKHLGTTDQRLVPLDLPAFYRRLVHG